MDATKVPERPLDDLDPLVGGEVEEGDSRGSARGRAQGRHGGRGEGEVVGELVDQLEGLTAVVVHETDGRGRDHAVQHHEEVVFRLE